jgi:hypothetical protein
MINTTKTSINTSHPSSCAVNKGILTGGGYMGKKQSGNPIAMVNFQDIFSNWLDQSAKGVDLKEKQSKKSG